MADAVGESLGVAARNLISNAIARQYVESRPAHLSQRRQPALEAFLETMAREIKFSSGDFGRHSLAPSRQGRYPLKIRRQGKSAFLEQALQMGCDLGGLLFDGESIVPWLNEL